MGGKRKLAGRRFRPTVDLREEVGSWLGHSEVEGKKCLYYGRGKRRWTYDAQYWAGWLQLLLERDGALCCVFVLVYFFRDWLRGDVNKKQLWISTRGSCQLFTMASM